MEGSALFSLHYLAPVGWWANYLQSPCPIIEQHENFVKSSYRNRCEILTSQKVQTLSIPLEGGRDTKRLYRDVKIANNIQWQKQHWQSIVSAYGSSPFYEHYTDKLNGFYKKTFNFLFDWNLELHNEVCSWLKCPKAELFTQSYEVSENVNIDLREPNRNPHYTHTVEYHQTFSPAGKFEANLSILDLMMNEGPAASALLKRAINRSV